MDSPPQETPLTLGWQVNPEGEPEYWLQENLGPGGQTDEHLVRVPARTMATHTVVIAQSGAGKSTFLGRLLEELLLHTRSQCIILDPNSDFRRMHETRSADLWENVAYDSSQARAELPTESSREDFRRPWSRVSIGISGGDTLGEGEPPYGQVQLWWPSLSMEFLGEALSPLERSELYHCHAYVQAIADLAGIETTTEKEILDIVGTAERLYVESSDAGGSPADFQLALSRGLRRLFSVDKLTKDALDKTKGVQSVLSRLWPLLPFPLIPEETLEDLVRERIRTRFERALTAMKYVSPAIARFYFAKAREYRAAGILAEAPPDGSGRRTLEVVDLPSLPERTTRLLVLSETLAAVWDTARAAWAQALRREPEEDKRVPTFIVVDEAHNLLPAEPRSPPEIALQEQFRQIVAEGRKYGLFLILVSQRPDKLDPLVLSECENKALMRLDSERVLSLTEGLLGLESLPSDVLHQTLNFGIGRALLTGRWAPEGPQVVYTAARRTVEGGRNLRAAYWAKAPRQKKR